MQFESAGSASDSAFGVCDASARGLTLAGVPRDAPLRDRLEAAAAMGYRWVQLDAAEPSCRARELDRSARRDVAATLRRRELRFAGLDLWIPRAHLTEAAHADRAVAAAIGAIELAAELAGLAGGRALLAMELPPISGSADEGRAESTAAAAARSEIVDAAHRAGVTLADFAALADAETAAGATAHAEGTTGMGLDPAGLLLARGLRVDLGSIVAAAKEAIVDARLSDASAVGRVAPGGGELDPLGYTVSLSTAGYSGPMLADLRGVPEGWSAAKRLLA